LVAVAGAAGTLLPGQTDVLTAGLAFGNFEQTSIHGFNFNEVNGSSLDNGEPRLAGRTIMLVSTNGQGQSSEGRLLEPFHQLRYGAVRDRRLLWSIIGDTGGRHTKSGQFALSRATQFRSGGRSNRRGERGWPIRIRGAGAISPRRS
jgi:hypothetical protein